MSRSILILLMALVAITLSVPNTNKKQHPKTVKNSSGRPEASNQADNPKPLAPSSKPTAALQEAPKRPPLQIVGGQNAVKGQFPYHVSIRNGVGHRCSGSLIAKNVVLTTATCVRIYKASDLLIVAGTAQMSSLGGQTHYVSEIILHPLLDVSVLKNDIAVLILSSSVRCNEDVKIIKLNPDVLRGGERGVVIGWGLTAKTAPATPDFLQYLEISVLPNTLCKEYFSIENQKNLHDSSVCSLGPSGTGICYGDGGAPVVVNGKLGAMGSWMIPCALGTPDVHTRISSYVPWINSILQSGNCGDGCGCNGGSGCGGGW